MEQTYSIERVVFKRPKMFPWGRESELDCCLAGIEANIMGSMVWLRDCRGFAHGIPLSDVEHIVAVLDPKPAPGRSGTGRGKKASSGVRAATVCEDPEGADTGGVGVLPESLPRETEGGSSGSVQTDSSAVPPENGEVHDDALPSSDRGKEASGK